MFPKNLVSCSQCRFFTKDKIGSGHGVGKCQHYEDYKAKKPGASALKAALRKLGNRDHEGDLFYGGQLVDRICQKYDAMHD